jgi:hypothetical protein
LILLRCPLEAVIPYRFAVDQKRGAKVDEFLRDRDPSWHRSAAALAAVPAVIDRLCTYGPPYGLLVELDQIPGWENAPEIRSSIERLLLKFGKGYSEGYGQSTGGEILSVLARIDPQWTKSSEANHAAGLMLKSWFEWWHSPVEPSHDEQRSKRVHQIAELVGICNPSSS